MFPGACEYENYKLQVASACPFRMRTSKNVSLSSRNHCIFSRAAAANLFIFFFLHFFVGVRRAQQKLQSRARLCLSAKIAFAN